ncbi:hypothetical protein PBI_REDNO2_110 [Mycobacterium phage Redno2]|uniref:hypothetical protein n=1 Tax=Mycobacterium phage Redno2 TaxID=1340709 RepID=UPI000387A990|nr:hypothetical protein N860_gp110 [Mycobacterium phage Redno2]AGS82409.1 hypothetical protein PBI_REDNO2_110 [Mycobacterium phage Redno2]
MDAPIQKKLPRGRCAMLGCGNRHLASGYCYAHYVENCHAGELPRKGGVCLQEGCDDEPLARGLCNSHYNRIRDELPLRPRGPAPRSVSVHAKLAYTWGPAKNYPCIECGQRAAHWAYDGTDPTQHLDYGSSSAKNKGWYSQWIEFYMPMCVKCHMTRDGAKAAAELAEYREWKYATKMTLADIAVIKVGPPNA